MAGMGVGCIRGRVVIAGMGVGCIGGRVVMAGMGVGCIRGRVVVAGMRIGCIGGRVRECEGKWKIATMLVYNETVASMAILANDKASTMC